MFWQKKSGREETKKLPKPRDVPPVVSNHLSVERKKNPAWLKFLKAVVREKSAETREFHIRVFDPAEAEAMGLLIRDYTSLDAHPQLVIYEGWYDEASKRVELEEKRVSQEVPILSQAEILEKVQGLSEPGSTVFFYQAAGPLAGGPLGRGAAVVELNPDYPGKGQRKYRIYSAPVFDMQPIGKGQKLWDSDDPKKIAAWIKESHRERAY